MNIEPDVEAQKPSNQVTQQDLVNIFSLPAVLADHFFAGNSSGLVRLTFAEKTMGIEGSPAIPRTTVVLTPYGAKQLHTLLTNVVNQMNEQQAQKPEREKLN